jgi:Tol biopolymer transport system component
VKDRDIYTVNPDGSALTQLTDTGGMGERAPTFSPDGNYIAFTRNSGETLWVMRSDGTEARRVTHTAGTMVALSWSPDGKKILYYRSDSPSGIWVVNADGSSPRSLLEEEAVGTPTWSPDGTKIAFRRDTQIWTMNADGTGLSQLVTGQFISASPNWSPDGTQILFEGIPCCGDESDLYTIPSGGGSATLVTTDPSLLYSRDPVWSPDGSKIVFEECRDPFNIDCKSDLYVMNSDGSGVTLLQSTPVDESEPDWQPAVGPALQPIPDALAKIAFVSTRYWPGFTDANDIFTMNPDGTLQRQVNDDSDQDLGPTWSPDGAKIAFMSERVSAGTFDWDIWAMNADGSGMVNLTNTGPTVDESDSAWSPDGTRIAYWRSEPRGIWLMNADGSNQTQLTAGISDIGPSWSPDGTKIAFMRSNAIHTMNPDGTGIAPLTAPPTGSHDSGPDWSPDGTSIAFERHVPGQTPRNIWKINVDGTGEQQLTSESLGAVSPSWSPEGTRIAFVRNSTNPFHGVDVFVMASNGTGQVNITNSPGDDTQPDWAPVRPYPRPKEARMMHMPLVVAYEACTSPNRSHGPPLASPSCHPPQRLSHLTVGAKAVGFVRLAQVGELPIDLTNGDQADVRIQVKITDVRNQSDLSDYAGGVAVSAARRITDRDNAPYPGGPGQATVQDHSLFFTAPCTATSDSSVGSTCELETTADALLPGSVKEMQRAVWQLDQISVHDGGPDANPETAPGNRPFMTQGVFIP